MKLPVTRAGDIAGKPRKASAANREYRVSPAIGVHLEEEKKKRDASAASSDDLTPRNEEGSTFSSRQFIRFPRRSRGHAAVASKSLKIATGESF